MGLPRDGLSAQGACCAAVGPCDGECDDDQQGGELAGIRDVGVLDVQATGLGVRKQTFDPPSLAVEIEAAPAVIKIGGDDEQLAILDTLCGKTEPVGGRCLHAAQPAGPCAAATLAQECPKLA